MNKKEKKQLLVFGYGLPLICFILAWRQYAKHGFTFWVEGFIVVGAIVLSMSFFAQPWLRVLFKYWMSVAKAIGTVVTMCILTIFFVGIIAPISIILQLMGRDLLNLRVKSPSGSYWVKRENKMVDYIKQY